MASIISGYEISKKLAVVKCPHEYRELMKAVCALDICGALGDLQKFRPTVVLQHEIETCAYDYGVKSIIIQLIRENPRNSIPLTAIFREDVGMLKFALESGAQIYDHDAHIVIACDHKPAVYAYLLSFYYPLLN